MRKQVSQYTLGEIKERCVTQGNGRGGACFRCPVDNWCSNYLTGSLPKDWDLSDPISFTEEERNFASVLQESITSAHSIFRDKNRSLFLLSVDGQVPTLLNFHLFPSLAAGKRKSLDEIIYIA